MLAKQQAPNLDSPDTSLSNATTGISRGLPKDFKPQSTRANPNPLTSTQNPEARIAKNFGQLNGDGMGLPSHALEKQKGAFVLQATDGVMDAFRRPRDCVDRTGFKISGNTSALEIIFNVPTHTVIA